MGDLKLYNAYNACKSWISKFPFGQNLFGKKQPIVIRLLALSISPVTCRRRPDKVRKSIRLSKKSLELQKTPILL